MDFNLTDEQRQLQDALSKLLRRDYTFEHRRQTLRSADGMSRETWRALADMGVLAIGTDERYGGLGGNAYDTMVVMEEFGRALLIEPYVPAIVMAAGAIARAGDDAQRERWLPGLLGGEQIVTFAHEEPHGRYEFARVATRAAPVGDGCELSGCKCVVPFAHTADLLLVSARESGADDSPDGVSMFVIPRDAEGVRIDAYATHDGMRAADVTLTRVRVTPDQRVGAAGQAASHVSLALERAIVAVCAEAVGAMASLLDVTTAYLKTRRQFGVPIGSFQALQHRMADMLMRTEQARSMAILATSTLDAADAAGRARHIAAAKVLVGRAARYVGEQAVQLHGGIGVTDDVDVSHYFKRLSAIDLAFGDADHHLQRYGTMLSARG